MEGERFGGDDVEGWGGRGGEEDDAEYLARVAPPDLGRQILKDDHAVRAAAIGSSCIGSSSYK